MLAMRSLRKRPFDAFLVFWFSLFALKSLIFLLWGQAQRHQATNANVTTRSAADCTR
jgi:hypothetical protein